MWFYNFAQKFIPAVVPTLSKLKIVSARSTYETMFPDSPLKWKVRFLISLTHSRDSFASRLPILRCNHCALPLTLMRLSRMMRCDAMHCDLLHTVLRISGENCHPFYRN